ncbi:FAD-dependent tricarballylate dehydrogenase TcuA [Maricurvus nonylphenolicus]|uniref:FAD-dependent oxidoreductase n=1 Tax=Maricurvus nonylphenolicus TaxID=1008307 RepID=UPI0036F21AF9
MKQHHADVVIIGAGAAGLSCALTALEAGSKVINIERSTQDMMGGNTRWTEANLLLQGGPEQEGFELNDMFYLSYAINKGFHVDPDIEAETVNDYENWSALAKTTQFVDPELLGTFADSIPPTLEWLTERGVQINPKEPETIPFCMPTLPYVKIYGGGLAIIEKLVPQIEEKGGQFLFETTAHKLIEENGTVVGVRCSGKNNETIDVFGKVVLASGGFEGNPQMLVQYGGQEKRYMRPVAKGGLYNKGEGLRMALELNAAAAGDWSDCHQQVVDSRTGLQEAMVNIWPFGIMVNQKGERFMDEAPNNILEWQEEPPAHITRQPGGIGYIIYDEKLASDTESSWKYGIRTDMPPVQANSLEELAALLMIPVATLKQTVADYNASCVNADKVNRCIGDQNVDFMSIDIANHQFFDGAGTEGVYPPKQNYAAPIDSPPYYCYPAISSICFTHGGLRVNGNAQVVNSSGEVIPGLYAAGETVGMHYGIYTVGTSVLRGLCFGRIAGAHATNS